MLRRSADRGSCGNAQMLGGPAPPAAAQQQRSGHVTQGHDAGREGGEADLSALRVLPPDAAERWRATIL